MSSRQRIPGVEVNACLLHLPEEVWRSVAQPPRALHVPHDKTKKAPPLARDEAENVLDERLPSRLEGGGVLGAHLNAHGVEGLQDGERVEGNVGKLHVRREGTVRAHGR